MFNSVRVFPCMEKFFGGSLLEVLVREKIIRAKLMSEKKDSSVNPRMFQDTNFVLNKLKVKLFISFTQF